MSQDKLQAYAQTQKSSMRPREVEAMAFTKAALMLEEAKEVWLEVDSYNLEKLFKPDTTELD